jgi:hypothetical protein
MLPAAGWLLLVVLRWFGITEEFTVLESTIEGTGAAFIRGLMLFVALPLVAAVFALLASRRVIGHRAAYIALSMVGVLLALANMVTRRTGN